VAYGSSVAFDTQEMHPAWMAVARNNATEFAFCMWMVDPPSYYNALEMTVMAEWLPSFMRSKDMITYLVPPLLMFQIPAATYCSVTTA
jgi:hypothetical protein